VTILPSRLAGALAAATFAIGIAQGAHAQPIADLSPYFTPATNAVATPDEDGFIRRWLVLEPIAKPNRTNQGFTRDYVRNALATALPDGLDRTLPHDGQTIHQNGAALQWHALDASLFDVKLFNVAQSLGKPTYGVIFWVTTVINADHDIADAHLAVGSNSASIWWFNGVETSGLYGDRRMVMDDVVSPRVTLRKGRNVLRGAVINGPGLSDFCVRFVDDAGVPIKALTITAR